MYVYPYTNYTYIMQLHIYKSLGYLMLLIMCVYDHTFKVLKCGQLGGYALSSSPHVL